jgi:zinc transport system substrate-binding protein
VKKVLLLVIIIGVIIVATTLFVPSTVQQPSTKEQPTVAVSTFALYDIVRSVAEGIAEPFMIVPFGTDLHTFRPTPQDLARLEKSKVIFYSGAGLEPWSRQLMADYETRSVDMSKHVELRYLDGREAAHHDHGHDGHGHDQHEQAADGMVDPHYWLSVSNMIKATKEVEGALSAAMPEYARHFHRNSEVYITQLYMLDNRLKEELSACKQPMIVVNHNAFGYMAERYGFEVMPLTGLSPESMPSAKRMAELTKLVKEKGLNTIFFESFVSDRLITEIGKETGAQVDVLQPLGNITADEAAKKLNYMQLMERNLNRLKTAMECQ